MFFQRPSGHKGQNPENEDLSGTADGVTGRHSGETCPSPSGRVYCQQKEEGALTCSSVDNKVFVSYIQCFKNIAVFIFRTFPWRLVRTLFPSVKSLRWVCDVDVALYLNIDMLKQSIF